MKKLIALVFLALSLSAVVEIPTAVAWSTDGPKRCGNADC